MPLGQDELHELLELKFKRLDKEDNNLCFLSMITFTTLSAFTIISFIIKNFIAGICFGIFAIMFLIMEIAFSTRIFQRKILYCMLSKKFKDKIINDACKNELEKVLNGKH